MHRIPRLSHFFRSSDVRRASQDGPAIVFFAMMIGATFLF